MTPSYDCNYVITGNSTNKGAFREEGVASTLRRAGDQRTIEELRAKFAQDVIAGYLDAAKPWRTNPKYMGLTDLKVELGEIRMVGD